MGEIQAFNDGVVNIYSLKNIAAPGNMPKDGLEIKHNAVRYEERTVGITRYWSAMENNVKIDMVLRVPRLKNVSSQDIAIPSIDGKQYKIKEIQYPKNVEPPSMDLSLERIEEDYDIS